jgi:hypothetical protein
LLISTIDSLLEKFRMLGDRLGINHIFVGEDHREFAPVVQLLSGT